MEISIEVKKEDWAEDEDIIKEQLKLFLEQRGFYVYGIEFKEDNAA